MRSAIKDQVMSQNIDVVESKALPLPTVIRSMAPNMDLSLVEEDRIDNNGIELDGWI